MDGSQHYLQAAYPPWPANMCMLTTEHHSNTSILNLFFEHMTGVTTLWMHAITLPGPGLLCPQHINTPLQLQSDHVEQSAIFKERRKEGSKGSEEGDATDKR